MMIPVYQDRTRLIGQLSIMYSTWAILLAAGSGSRMGGKEPKQFLEWNGRPLYWHSARVLARCVQGLVFVFNDSFLEREKKRIGELASLDNLGVPWVLCSGGSRRQDSCLNGLAHLPFECQAVLVHDAARPFLTAELVRRVQQEITPENPCIVPALPVSDTIKLVFAEDSARVESTLPRDRLRACQTPQGFWKEALQAAFTARNVTDEAMLMEQNGATVKVVSGDPCNIKITHPEDLRHLMADRIEEVRTGFGYDVHRYGGDKPLKLGGVPIPGNITVAAHSDGDVLLHALMDALLGLAALGDIGRHFPESDPELAGINSALLLDQVLEMIDRQGWKPRHVDLTIVAQKPRIAPYSQAIVKNIARLLKLPLSAINLKATTEEHLGFTGEGRGIKAYALATGVKKHLVRGASV